LGANVIAVDLDRPKIWERLISIARNSCGTLYMPVKRAVDANADDAALAAVAGYDTAASVRYASSRARVCMCVCTERI
jgi:hypothetical protein